MDAASLGQGTSGLFTSDTSRSVSPSQKGEYIIKGLEAVARVSKRERNRECENIRDGQSLVERAETGIDLAKYGPAPAPAR